MAVRVNGHELTDAEVAEELPFHQQAPAPWRSAVITLILKRLVLTEAARHGLQTDDPEAAADFLLDTQVRLPVVDEVACRRHYEQHPLTFRQGAWVEASHILFAVREQTPLAALRQVAEETLAMVRAEPGRFEALAAERSNCPSGQQGGGLGRLRRGECVPEFEAALWRIEPGAVADRVIESRHGLHVVRVDRRDDGRLLPFEAVAGDIAQALRAANQDAAWRQYVQLLLGRAQVEGIELAGDGTALVQ